MSLIARTVGRRAASRVMVAGARGAGDPSMPPVAPGTRTGAVAVAWPAGTSLAAPGEGWAAAAVAHTSSAVRQAMERNTRDSSGRQPVGRS